MVAFAWASNAVGTIVDAARVCRLAHEAGALAWVDAVHYAAHEPIDVRAIGADVLICSPYKFCGPHLGVAYGRAEVIERGGPTRPARPDEPARPPVRDRNAPYELLAGFNATIDYLDSIGGFDGDRSVRARARPAVPGRHLRAVTVYGLPGMEGRVPTFLINVEGVPATEVAAKLAEQEMGVWAHDSWYSLGLYKRLGYDDAAVRLGFIHYNSDEEVDRLIGALEGLTSSR